MALVLSLQHDLEATYKVALLKVLEETKMAAIVSCIPVVNLNNCSIIGLYHSLSLRMYIIIFSLICHTLYKCYKKVILCGSSHTHMKSPVIFYAYT